VERAGEGRAERAGEGGREGGEVRGWEISKSSCAGTNSALLSSEFSLLSCCKGSLK
jgi:hypothetical protein